MPNLPSGPFMGRVRWLRAPIPKLATKLESEGFCMRDDIAERVITTLASVKRIPADTITPESSLQELGIDSLDTFTLLFELESKFSISIPDDEARNIRTVNDIVEGVRKLVNANGEGSVPSAAPAS